MIENQKEPQCVEFNLHELSDEELKKISDAGEDGAGYLAFQNAACLLSNRRSAIPELRKRADKADEWIIKITPEDLQKVQSILESRDR